MNKLLYIGTGLHIKPVVHFANTKEFVFVDTLPRSQHDGLIVEGKYFYDGFYRHKFISLLIQKCKKYGFEITSTKVFNQEYYNNKLLIEQKELYGFKENFNLKFPNINSELVVFENNVTKQKIKYYISTNILFDMNKLLQMDISESSGLVISGYHPDKKILDWISNPIELYCYSQTVYKCDEDEIDNVDNLVYWMFNNLDKIDNYFNKIFICERDTGITLVCDNLLDMNNKALTIRENRNSIQKIITHIYKKIKK